MPCPTRIFRKHNRQGRHELSKYRGALVAAGRGAISLSIVAEIADRFAVHPKLDRVSIAME